MALNTHQIDMIGFGGASLLFLLIVLSAYIFSLNWGKVTDMARWKVEQMNASAANPRSETSSPIDTTAPASNAPVLGPAKEMITPVKWDKRIEEGDFTFPEKTVIRWDLLPASVRTVSFGFRMKNPPLTGASPDKKLYHVVASDPASNGVQVMMEDRGEYVFNLGREKLTYKRDYSYWAPDYEKVELRITAITPSTSRVEVIFNGHEVLLSSSTDALALSSIRTWPQYLRVFHREKMADIWVTYSS